MPDSGGFAINHQPVLSKDLAKQLAAIYQGRPTRILLVQRTPGRRDRDLRTLMTLARRLGIILYEHSERTASI